MNSIDTQDITKIRLGQSFDIMNRGNTNTAFPVVDLSTAPIHNETFRVNSFVRPAPTARGLFGVEFKPKDTLDSETLLAGWLKEDYSAFARDPKNSLPRFNNQGQLEYVIDPITKKRVIKRYTLLDVMKDNRLLADQINKVKTDYEQKGTLGQRNKLHALALAAFDSLRLAMRPNEVEMRWKTCMLLPSTIQSPLTVKYIGLFHMARDEYIMPGQWMSRPVYIKMDALFMRNVANVMGDDYSAFRHWVRLIFAGGNENAEIDIGEIAKKSWFNGRFQQQGWFPLLGTSPFEKTIPAGAPDVEMKEPAHVEDDPMTGRQYYGQDYGFFDQQNQFWTCQNCNHINRYDDEECQHCGYVQNVNPDDYYDYDHPDEEDGDDDDIDMDGKKN